MNAGKEEAGEGSEKQYTLEKGHVFFFYRPNVECTEVTGLDDVDRLHMILKPEWRRDGGRLISRSIVVGGKTLPDVRSHQRYWSYVENVNEDIGQISQLLKGYVFGTAAYGELIQSEERAAAQGRYALLKYHNNTHLAFVIERPEQLGVVQQAFRIPKEGSFILCVKNPESAAMARQPSDRKAHYGTDLLQHFHGKSWTGAEPVDLLKNAQLWLVGETPDLKEGLKQLGERLEEEALEELRKMKPLDDRQIFQELKIAQHEVPSLAVITGEWI
ncbi:Calpain catalytic domain-containing protein [Balamuthia mandrillaris]